jgi:hypothetical protein
MKGCFFCNGLHREGSCVFFFFVVLPKSTAMPSTHPDSNSGLHDASNVRRQKEINEQVREEPLSYRKDVWGSV